MNLFGWWKSRKIQVPNESDGTQQSDQALKRSEHKLEQAIRTQEEVRKTRDLFVKSVERAMRRASG